MTKLQSDDELDVVFIKKIIVHLVRRKNGRDGASFKVTILFVEKRIVITKYLV